MRHVKSQNQKRGGVTMADDTKANETPENDTQESPMPSEDQKTPDSSDDATASPAPREEAASSTEDQELPSDTTERTRAEFEKMRKRYAEERAKREYYENMFTTLKTQPQKEQEEEVAPIYDPNTGLLNENVLTDIQRKTFEAEKRARAAEAAIKEYEQNRQKEAYERENQETYKEFPELDKKNKKLFNQELHVETRKLMFDSMLNPDDYKGKNLSFIEAAKLAKQRIGSTLDEARKEGATEAIEKLTPKEQASLDAVGSPGRRNEVGQDLETLRQRTRAGDRLAAIERTKRILGQE